MDLKDFEPYIDKYGLIQPEPGKTSQNGIRFSVEACLGLIRHRSKWDAGDFVRARRDAIKACYKQPGLLRRHPESNEQEGPDDYYAASCFGYFFDRSLSKDIYEYGAANGWIFNNVDPGHMTLSSYLGRQPALVAHMKHCAGLQLNWGDQLAMAAGIFLSARDGSQDGYVLTWFMVKAIKGKYWIIDKAIVYWQRSLRNAYSGGIGDVLGAYYSPVHWEHPNSKALMGEFGD